MSNYICYNIPLDQPEGCIKQDKIKVKALVRNGTGPLGLGMNSTRMLHCPSAAQLIIAERETKSPVCRLSPPKCDSPALENLHRPLTPHARHLTPMAQICGSSPTSRTYLAVLSRAARSAAAPAWTDVSDRYDLVTCRSPSHPTQCSYNGPRKQSRHHSGAYILAVEPSFFLNEKQGPVGHF